MAKKNSKGKCFIISPIGGESTPIRERASRVLEFIIRPAVTRAGYQPIRADEISLPGLITHQIIELLLQSPLVIADLTGGNPNVFYEVAIRHATTLPIIHMIDADERPPFDVSQFRAITFRHDDLKSAEAAKHQISDQIRAMETEPGRSYNPISLTVALLGQDQKSAPNQGLERELLARIEDLHGAVSALKGPGVYGAFRANGPGYVPLQNYVIAIARALQPLQFLRASQWGVPSDEALNIVRRLGMPWDAFDDTLRQMEAVGLVSSQGGMGNHYVALTALGERLIGPDIEDVRGTNP
jgi:hypothetical protein